MNPFVALAFLAAASLTNAANKESGGSGPSLLRPASGPASNRAGLSFSGGSSPARGSLGSSFSGSLLGAGPVSGGFYGQPFGVVSIGGFGQPNAGSFAGVGPAFFNGQAGIPFGAFPSGFPSSAGSVNGAGSSSSALPSGAGPFSFGVGQVAPSSVAGSSSPFGGSNFGLGSGSGHFSSGSSASSNIPVSVGAPGFTGGFLSGPGFYWAAPQPGFFSYGSPNYYVQGYAPYVFSGSYGLSSYGPSVLYGPHGGFSFGSGFGVGGSGALGSGSQSPLTLGSRGPSSGASSSRSRSSRGGSSSSQSVRP